ncbi:SPOR domain-containing protein [Gilvibacter sp.]|uniref:SPOR domain-containing protein n=1 Tax=Gilvibacter sp. TaxID=2729997 RepID=UPI003F49B6C2
MMKRIEIKMLILGLIALFSIQNTTAQQGQVTVNEDPQIAELLDLKKSMEKNNKLADGYTIQLYYGELNTANSTLRKYRNSFAEWPANIEYETPNYKVWVGNFSTRLEADQALVKIQDKFPAAFPIKRSRAKKKDE